MVHFRRRAALYLTGGGGGGVAVGIPFHFVQGMSRFLQNEIKRLFYSSMIITGGGVCSREPSGQHLELRIRRCGVQASPVALFP